jgi:monoamine oxidase
VADWLNRISAPTWLGARVRALRGLFLADPEELSLLALVDFFGDDQERRGQIRRVRGGNDRLVQALVRALGRPVELSTILRRVTQREAAVTITIEQDGQLSERQAEFLVVTLPASTLRDVIFDPPLPVSQQQAIARLRYGHATRTLLQFDRRFWKHSVRPTAFGSDLETGAIWDGNEEQRGKSGILSLLAGGAAADATNDLLNREGPEGIRARLGWLGKPAKLLTATSVDWDRDPWSRGGYAYFDPGFDPRWRDSLAEPFGRVAFAGEHTSVRWQGYMNGAIETGQRAAYEIAALAAPRRR